MAIIVEAVAMGLPPSPEMPSSVRSAEATAHTSRSADGGYQINLTGQWRSPQALRAGEDVARVLAASPKPSHVTIEGSAIEEWDSVLIACLMRIDSICRQMNVAVEFVAVPMGAVKLLRLATAVPERTGTRQDEAKLPFLAKIGTAAASKMQAWQGTVRFLGEVILALAAFLRGKASYRREDLLSTLQETGAQALPIVSIITLLIGLILAFIGAVQLAQFGASLYVADLVGLAMTREMAAVMTAIVLAGRTGAAFAAQLGTMQGNEEIDALTTLGISPVEFLVLPRMLALALMMPVLYVYGCFIGLFGGYLVGTGMLGLSADAYIDRTREAVHLIDFMIGFVKSAVFGLVVAFAGCQRGMEAGRSAAAVGTATTSAVVSAIVYIIVIDAIFAMLLNVLRI
jgi:phospholipid/cholesterol/gamma-HCH transport system permease protein